MAAPVNKLRLRWQLAACLLLACIPAAAEYVEPGTDWRENAAGAPPAYDSTRLIAVESPRGSALSFGIDPKTIAVGTDGVVRYVVVASSQQGADTALFEGIRCSNGEFRTYARRNKGEAEWSPADGGSTPWKPLASTGLAAHAKAIAQAGICVGHAPNTPIDQMVRDLRQAASEIRLSR